MGDGVAWDQPISAQEWLDGFAAAMAEFIAERPVSACAVRLWLSDDEAVMVKGMRPGWLPRALLVDPYPSDMSAMVTRDDDVHAGLPDTPTRMLVWLDDVVRVEFIAEPPDQHPKRPMGIAAD